MRTPDPESPSEQTLRSWRLLAAVLVVLQLLGLVGLLVALFIASVSDRTVAYAIAAAILLMEVGQWGLAKAALRRVHDFDRHERYALVPLPETQHRLVEFNFAASLIAPVWLALEIPSSSVVHPKLLAVVLLEVAFAPGSISLWRVRRCHSWLAISRIPSTPRRRFGS